MTKQYGVPSATLEQAVRREISRELSMALYRTTLCHIEAMRKLLRVGDITRKERKCISDKLVSLYDQQYANAVAEIKLMFPAHADYVEARARARNPFYPSYRRLEYNARRRARRRA